MPRNQRHYLPPGVPRHVARAALTPSRNQRKRLRAIASIPDLQAALDIARTLITDPDEQRQILAKLKQPPKLEDL